MEIHDICVKKIRKERKAYKSYATHHCRLLWIVRLWFWRWVSCLNNLPHSLHLKRLSFLWTWFTWRVRPSRNAKLLEHWSQKKLRDFSWTLAICFLRLPGHPKVRLHLSHLVLAAEDDADEELDPRFRRDWSFDEELLGVFRFLLLESAEEEPAPDGELLRRNWMSVFFVIVTKGVLRDERILHTKKEWSTKWQ